ncbi:uncharacterized protein LOC119674903 [Teleopsis dalmanni]|uniref:uncharacterized protein LOC119664019 n=1 Tax=Teleopsis dalmanni TaxID=139649 RepID=UPI0018CEAC76|nr:uncharacterized protein LOC119664019 [Teleopsis dalmanni]XP_037941987.1 uncharacterized protein LOC119674903 [Teleopsis dalmanni]
MENRTTDHKTKRSVFPVTLDQFIEYTNVIKVVEDHIKSKHPVLLKEIRTRSQSKEIMMRAKNIWKTYYKRPHKRVLAPIAHVAVNDDCDEDMKRRILKIPGAYKYMLEEEESVDESEEESIEVRPCPKSIKNKLLEEIRRQRNNEK